MVVVVVFVVVVGVVVMLVDVEVLVDVVGDPLGHTICIADVTPFGSPSELYWYTHKFVLSVDICDVVALSVCP